MSMEKGQRSLNTAQPFRREPGRTFLGLSSLR
jgi:hypothetical protein